MKSKAASIIANRAQSSLPSMITELIENNHPDDSIILGYVKVGNRCIQVQLHITQEEDNFMEWIG